MQTITKLTFRQIFLLAMTMSSAVSAEALVCQEVFSKTDVWTRIEQEIRPREEKVDFFNKVDYLRESRRMMSSGLVQSKFDRDLDTRMYFAGTAIPNIKTGEQQMVDPNSKAVYVMIHGSGTMKSSGRNFYHLMNTLGQMGYSAVSFDLPYHMEGPRRHSLHDVRQFRKWLDTAMAKVKAESGNKPIYMVGHSFGPDVIMEYLAHHPSGAQGAALISPASFDPVLTRWYDRFTSKMKFGGDVAENTMAGTWSATVSNQFVWNKTNGTMDPTIANPQLRLRMLSGDREEYVPAPLGANGLPNGKNTYDIRAAFLKHVRNAEVTIEPGVGHYIFAHKDSQGRNVVLREILALDGVDAKFESQLIKDHAAAKALNLIDALTLQYSTDRLFKSFVDTSFSQRSFRRALEQRDEALLKRVEIKYREAKQQLDDSIREDILKLAVADEAFYAKNKIGIDLLKSGKRDSSLFPAYAEYLANQ